MSEILYAKIDDIYSLLVYADGVVEVSSHHPRSKGRNLSQWFTASGHLRTKLHSKSVCIHTLIAKCFLGDRPEGLVINHIDGNKLNNHPSNLEYCTQAENIAHAMHMGLHVARTPERHGKYIDGRSLDQPVYKHQHYLDNIEKYKERGRLHYQKNKEAAKARARAHYKRKKELANAEKT